MLGLGLLRCPAERSPHTLVLAILCIIAMGAAKASGTVNRAATHSCEPGSEQPIYIEEGLATWYSPRAIGHRTASGEPTERHALTAAHRTLPFGSIVRITNLESCRAVKVTINDRGPTSRRNQKRILDVSKPAALALGMTRGGVAKIRLEEFQSDQPAR